MSSVNINVGISSIEEIIPLISVGANEFYAGLSSKNIPLFNHRFNIPDYNFSNMRDFRQAIKICHLYGKPIFLAVNNLSYSQYIYEDVVDTMFKLMEMGVDGFMVSDFYLLRLINKRASRMKIKVPRLHLSSLANCFDAITADFYKQFNIMRIILPQQLYACEATDIILYTGLETEVFFHKASNCYNLDGRCHFCYYSVYPKRLATIGFPCRYKFNILNWKKIKKPESFYARWALPSGINSYGNLYDYVKMGVTAIKIGIRDKTRLQEKLRLVRQLSEAIAQIFRSRDKTTFLRKVTNV